MGHLQRDLLAHSDYTFGRTKDRLDGLTDEEWAWEPADWCWSVRRVGDGWRADGSAFPPSVTPITTISWRLAHLIDNYAAIRNWTWLGLDSPGPAAGCSGTAAGEIARLEDAYARWRGALVQADDASLASRLGPIAGEYAEGTRASFVLHELDEVIHHAAEIGVLRDLYRARTIERPALDTVAAAAANSCWARVVELAESGADVNGPGMTPLHLAVAVGATEVVQVLLAHGADTTARDPEYDATAQEWAEFFHQTELAALLS
jgi:hypothetical protein